MSKQVGLWTRMKRKVDRLRGRPIEYDLRPYQKILENIKDLSSSMRLKSLDLPELKAQALSLKHEAELGRPLDDLLPPVYALAREAVKRILGIDLFDVQLIGAIALHRGHLVEMQTGEGKTVTAVLPAALNALGGRGVHVLTFNDYLAGRDAEWMRPIYSTLGIEARAITEGMDRTARRQAYRADVTYLTAKEAGYDYLRESLIRRKEDLILRPYHYAIVDEADSILIDEARIPLVIAGTGGPCDELRGEGRERLALLVKTWVNGRHYQTDENLRNVFLTEEGIQEAERQLGCGDLHQTENLGLLTRLNQALHAQVLLRRDVDYIVRDGRAGVVDEFTGRLVADRHWPDGLHRALEAKESLHENDPGQILNSLTLQHFMDLYPKRCGMTGTAVPAEWEFQEFYHLTTVIIPPNRPSIRRDMEDVLFADLEAKHTAIAQEVQKAHARGQPILIGTSSVQESQTLARRLSAHGLECQVLNAANDQAEAEIIKEAGAPGAITVSTNMAGRGTDIRLGGADEQARDAVLQCGGLYVIGTNRHESRRIDNQLRGRAGRQGEPGVSRFFISLEDPLLKKFGIDELIGNRRFSSPGAPPSNRFLHKTVALIQRRIEGQNMDIRRTLWNYSTYVEEKRKQLYAQRTEALLADSPALSGGEPEHGEIERQIVLHHTDCAWRDYLAHIADLREAIYLNVIGSRDPLQEFLKMAAQSFLELQNLLLKEIQTTRDLVRMEQGSIPQIQERLRGPSSTWTYLINDNPFEYQLSLASARHIGSGAWAAVLAAWFWFVPAGYALVSWIRRWIKKRQ